jgi:hypothetical protein
VIDQPAIQEIFQDGGDRGDGKRATHGAVDFACIVGIDDLPYLAIQERICLSRSAIR